MQLRGINRGKIGVLLGFFAVLFVLVYSGTNAATTTPSGFDNGFTVSPVRNLITISKGQSQDVQITVQNPSKTSAEVGAIINDFTASTDESGVPRLITSPKATLPLNNFIPLVSPIPNFNLGPNQQTIVDVRISVPKNASSGGYYGAIRFTPVNATGGQISLTANVASIFLITVPGNLYQHLSLVQLSAGDTNGNTSSFFTNGQLSVVTRLNNTGNIHVAPYGTIIVKDMFGKTIQTLMFNKGPSPGNILPQSIRKFVDPLNVHKWLGYYTITASIGYGSSGSGNDLIVSNASFWYVPTWILIGILVVLAIIIILIVWLIRSRRKTAFGRKLR
ncbi:MAG TPA: DUF916 domain-containing protein [Candidatus Saccharimonadia bacterium]|nr:DUF916 domain-containing protein [Candidatus Saccharimonadia bacterium]